METSKTGLTTQNKASKQCHIPGKEWQRLGPPSDLPVWSLQKPDGSWWTPVDNCKFNYTVAPATAVGLKVVSLLEQLCECILSHPYKEGGLKPICIHIGQIRVYFIGLSPAISTLLPHIVIYPKGIWTILNTTKHRLVHYINDMMVIRLGKQEVTRMAEFFIRSMYFSESKINPTKIQNLTH